MGVAVQKCFGTMVATVAEISLRNDKARVHCVWIVTDSGVVVNPDSATAQVEGGIMFGLTAAHFQDAKTRCSPRAVELSVPPELGQISMHINRRYMKPDISCAT